MLRCMIARRFLKNRQASCQELLSFRQSLAGKLYQTRSLSFLPIVSSHDTAKEGLSQKDELDQSRVLHTPVDICVTSPEISKPCDNTITERPHGKDDANSHGGSPTQHGYFSASLADGTIVHNLLRNMTLSQFEQVVILTSEIWKQCSHEIRSHVSAQSLGIAVWGLRDDDSTISARIYDIDASRGPRTVHHYKWSISTNNTNTTILERRGLPHAWNRTRKTLVSALENHVGSVDRDGSLVMLFRPSPHALYSAFKDIDRIFAYDVPATTHHPMSVVLDNRTFVSPIPGAVIESGTFLSLATISWQWWQQEQDLRNEALSGTTNVRIIETDLNEKCFRLEVWMLSQTASKGLARSVCKLFFSDINGSFVSSCLESRDEMISLRPGSDRLLLNNALHFLRNNIGWIDSAGKLVEGTYPDIQPLIDGLLPRRRSSKNLLASKSQLKMSATTPEPQAVAESGEQKLCDSTRQAGGVISYSHGERRLNDGTDEALAEDDKGSSALVNNNDDQTIVMSASLHDGTLVVPAIMRCQRMSSGVGLGFRDILSIISQWREQTRQDNNHGQFYKSLLIYVRPDVDPHSIEIDIFCRRDGWVENPAARHKLYHTPQTSGCSFVKAESIQVQIDIPEARTRRRRAKAVTDVFRRGLKNHVGTMNKNEGLQTSEQPTIHEALHDLEQVIKWPSPALNVTSEVETTHAETKYTPLNPTDNGKTGITLVAKPEQGLKRSHKDDDKGDLDLGTDRSVIVSATLHDGTLVVPSFKLYEQMSTGVGKGFSDFLRIISQWRTHSCHNSGHGQEMIYLYPDPLATSFDIGILQSDIKTFRSNLLERFSLSRCREQPMTRQTLHHTPGTLDYSYVKSERVCTYQLQPIKVLKMLLETFESGLENHVGLVDESGALQKSERLTAHKISNDCEKPFRVPDASSVTRKDTTHSRVRYTPLKPTDNGEPEKKAEQIQEVVQEISMHDQIASTMKLAGALFDMSIMLNEEISKAPSQKTASTSSNHIPSNLVDEPNPVFRTMKNGEIDIDAVKDAMAELRTRLGDHQDKDQILARVCKRWKEELETRYPMMKRKPVIHNDVDDLLSSRSDSPTATERAPKKSTISEPDKQNPPSKVRFVVAHPKLKPASTTADHKEDDKTPAEPRTADGRSKSTPTTTLGNPKEDEAPGKQQDALNSDRDGKQPYSRSSSGRNNGHSKNDVRFSIYAW